MSHVRTSPLKTLILSLLASVLVIAAHGAGSDAAATPVKTPPPVYPSALRHAGVSGIVAIRVVIDETGSVAEAFVSKSSNPDFDESALAAVKKWKFTAAKKDGAAVKTQMLIPIKFSLED